MFAQMFVVLELFHDQVEYVCPNAKVGLYESYEIFTIMRVHPYAILKTHKSIFLHITSQLGANALPPLRNIKYHDAPTPIPSTLLCHCRFFRFKLEHLLAFFSDSRIALPVFFNKFNATLIRKTPKHRLSFVIKSCSLLKSREKPKELCRIRNSRGDKHDAAHHNRCQHGLLKHSQTPLPPRTPFQYSHTHTLPRDYPVFGAIASYWGYLDN